MSRNNDNTAAGMALSQEESMYLTPEPSPIPMSVPLTLDDKENHAAPREDIKLDDDVMKHSVHRMADDGTTTILPPTMSAQSGHIELAPDITAPTNDNSLTGERAHQPPTESTSTYSSLEGCLTPMSTDQESVRTNFIPDGLAKIDLEMKRGSRVKLWDFTDRELSSRTPSAMLQPYAKYVGTQQSHNNTYNVEVTILTVDMDQCNMSGFLKISNLTPEHPVLETFFTGEIVGGPNQRYSFLTMDPAWGTTARVDMQHWQRFPAWKQFRSIAGRDMSFEYPLNGQTWYQQEHIFMRWKERFLAPDHRTSNLSGASFEGFYYICLNQMEGKIDGVYYHSDSAKFQKLELSHETKLQLDIANVGFCPLVEMR